MSDAPFVEGHGGRTHGMSRRGFLRVGALGLAGLTLPGRLRLRAAAAGRGGAKRHGRHPGLPRRRAVARRHVRPEARRPGRVPRRVPADRDERARRRGSGELLPRQARVMDRLAVVRSLHARPSADHGAGTHWVMTGYPPGEPNSSGQRPAERRLGRREDARGEPAGPAAVRGDPATRRRSARRRTSGPGSTRSASTATRGRRSGSATSTRPRASSLGPDRRTAGRCSRRLDRIDRDRDAVGGDGGHRPVHRRGVRDGHRPRRPPGVRPRPARTRGSATATAGPASARAACWPAGWSRRA